MERPIGKNVPPAIAERMIQRRNAIKPLIDQGLPLKDIAEQTGIPLPTVKKHSRELRGRPWAPVQDRMLRDLQQHQAQTPDAPILLKKVGKNLGVSKQRAHYMYHRLETKGEQLPPLTQSRTTNRESIK